MCTNPEYLSDFPCVNETQIGESCIECSTFIECSETKDCDTRNFGKVIAIVQLDLWEKIAKNVFIYNYIVYLQKNIISKIFQHANMALAGVIVENLAGIVGKVQPAIK